MTSQRFIIAARDRVLGGVFTYSYHPTTRELYFDGSVKIRMFFVPVELHFSGEVSLKAGFSLNKIHLVM